MKRNRNPESPWNPALSVKVTAEEYERQVVDWLREIEDAEFSYEVTHLEPLAGTSGEYVFDAVIRLNLLKGAEIIILVECKRHSRPLERKVVLELNSKLREVGAHKGMIFSTSGFQSGAIKYAAKNGIATIAFIDGSWTYETKSAGPRMEPPSWIQFPKFAGWFYTAKDGGITANLVSSEYLEVLHEWFHN